MSLRVTMKFKGRDLPKDWETFVAATGPYIQRCHNAGVLGIVADFVAWSRVDTGRMRAGWLPMLIRSDYPYQEILGSRKTDEAAVQEDAEVLRGLGGGGELHLDLVPPDGPPGGEQVLLARGLQHHQRFLQHPCVPCHVDPPEGCVRP